MDGFTAVEEELGHPIVVVDVPMLLVPSPIPEVVEIEAAPDGSIRAFTQARYLMEGDSVVLGDSVYPVKQAMGWDTVALFLGEHLAVSINGRERMELALLSA